MGRTYTRLTETQQKKVFQMVESGKTRKEIANEFNCSQGTVLRAYKKILTKKEETDRIVEIIGLHELKYDVIDGYVGYFNGSNGCDVKQFKSIKSDKKAIELFKQWIEEREFHYVAVDIPSEPEDFYCYQPEATKQITTPEVCEAIVIGDEPLKTDVYVIFSTAPKINAYGYFLSIDKALSELEKLNTVAKLLGHDEVFDILEVPLKEEAF